MSLSVYASAALAVHSYSAALRPDYVQTLLPGAAVEQYHGADILCALLSAPEDLVLLFRGTRPTDARSVRRNFRCGLRREDFYEVHQGFGDGLNTVWLQVLQRLAQLQRDAPRSVHLVGHSQGGALATIAAVRLLSLYLDGGTSSAPASLITFGAPRCGDSVFADVVSVLAHSACRVRRFRNCNDVVPNVPPVRWGYRHGVPETYLPAQGPPVEAPSTLWRLWDGLRDRVRTRTLRDSLEGHRMEAYRDKLQGVDL